MNDNNLSPDVLAVLEYHLTLRRHFRLPDPAEVQAWDQASEAAIDRRVPVGRPDGRRR